MHIMASAACRHARVLARPAGAALNSAMAEASSAMTQEQVCYRELGTASYRAYDDGAIDTCELHIAADSLSAHYRSLGRSSNCPLVMYALSKQLPVFRGISPCVSL